MLRIKRVPTILSNYQKDDADEGGPARGCGRNCLRNCCLPGVWSDASLFINFIYNNLVWNYVICVKFECLICCFLLNTGAKLPLYAFRKASKIELGDKNEIPVAFLDSLLLGEVILDTSIY